MNPSTRQKILLRGSSHGRDCVTKAKMLCLTCRVISSAARNLRSLAFARDDNRMVCDLVIHSRKREDVGGLRGLPILAMALLCLFIQGCVPETVTPKAPESSMLMGRVLIDTKYRGRNGLLPLGLHAGHIQVELRSEDGARTARSTTEDDGYFFFPNLAPDSYYVRSVVLEAATARKSDAIRFAAHALKGQVRPQTIVYLGTVWAEISQQGEIKLKELHEPEKARERLLRSHANAGWENREFVSAPPPSLQSPTQRLPVKRDASR